MAANLDVVLDLIDRAAADRADLVVLPENCLMLATNAVMRSHALAQDAPQLGALRARAVQHKLTVVLGGVKLRRADGVVNSALVIDPRGEIVGHYDKIHLFDARVAGQSFEASTVERAGDAPVLLDVDGVLLGLTICYDVRFPELYRALAAAGAQVILVPSAFTRVTGEAHWHTLLRARAIENGCYIVAPATMRSQVPGEDAFETYGHALVVGPWGEVLADLGEDRGAVEVIELDLSTVDSARASLPVLAGTKPSAYATVPRRVNVRTTEETR
jgi:predicted amidohydrolase